jgi:hypothetical protein
MSSEPDFVKTLTLGGVESDDPVTLHPIVAEDLDQQLREMEQSRALAAINSANYVVLGG